MTDPTPEPAGRRSAGRTPGPGRPVRGSRSGVPLNALFDLLGRRWALTALWALRDGPLTFRQIQALDERMSPTSLNRRLAELREVGLVHRTPDGYAVTTLGAELLQVGAPLVGWSERWARELERSADDPGRGAPPSGS